MDLASMLGVIQLASLFISAACFIAALVYAAHQRRRKLETGIQEQSRIQTNTTPLFFGSKSVRVVAKVVGKSDKGYVLDISPIEARYSSNNFAAKVKPRPKTNSVKTEPAEPSESREKEQSKIVFKWEDD